MSQQDAKQKEKILTWSKEMGEIDSYFIGEYNKFYARALTTCHCPWVTSYFPR